jgi:hypothetical protein
MDEDAIKAELRVLTEQTRKLRQELRGLLSTPQTRRTGALIRPKDQPGRPLPPVPPDWAGDRPTRSRKKG